MKPAVFVSTHFARAVSRHLKSGCGVVVGCVLLFGGTNAIARNMGARDQYRLLCTAARGYLQALNDAKSSLKQHESDLSYFDSAVTRMLLKGTDAERKKYLHNLQDKAQKAYAQVMRLRVRVPFLSQQYEKQNAECERARQQYAQEIAGNILRQAVTGERPPQPGKPVPEWKRKRQTYTSRQKHHFKPKPPGRPIRRTQRHHWAVSSTANRLAPIARKGSGLSTH